VTTLRTASAKAREHSHESFALCLLLLAILAIIRLIGLRYSVVDLYFDESQYWVWSRTPAFGYFTKPPLLAWVIAAAEFVCGSGEACIRSPAPLFHFATSLLVYAIGDMLYGRRVGFWAALTIAIAPGLSFSSRIISTDVPLLFFWAAALLAFLQLRNGGGTKWAIVLGFALGLGLLAKYAMIYFLLCVAFAAMIDADARKLLTVKVALIALGIALLLIIPNLLWNFENGFATFRHTAANVRGPGLQFSIMQGLKFVISQFAVFGPIAFPVLACLTAGFASRALSGEDRLMLAFVLPVLALVTATAFISRAHPNWAAAAYVSGAVVVSAVLLRAGARNWLVAGVAIGVIMQAALLAADSVADRLNVPWLARGNPYAPTLGWRGLGEQAEQIADRIGAASVVGDDRHEVASLVYYLRNRPRKVLAWPGGPRPRDHFQLTRPLTTAAEEPILLVTNCPTAARLEAQYATVEPLGRFEAATGPTTFRVYYAFRLARPSQTLSPLAGC
jgi:4-amino-4-deoxy-L-arabinose transferase-like glycosyltransferase